MRQRKRKATVDPGSAHLSPVDEVHLLRQGLWECYALAGGDPEHYDIARISSEDLVPLVLDCVRDLRGLFAAARRDLG